MNILIKNQDNHLAAITKKEDLKQLLFDIEQRPANMVFAIARLTEVIEHLYYYQLLCIFSADGFQMPCHRKYPNRYTKFLFSLSLTGVNAKLKNHHPS